MIIEFFLSLVSRLMNCLSKLIINFQFEGYFFQRNESKFQFLVVLPGSKAIQKYPSFIFIDFSQAFIILVLKTIKNSGCALNFNKINTIVLISTGWKNYPEWKITSQSHFYLRRQRHLTIWHDCNMMIDDKVSFSNFL